VHIAKQPGINAAILEVKSLFGLLRYRRVIPLRRLPSGKSETEAGKAKKGKSKIHQKMIGNYAKGTNGLLVFKTIVSWLKRTLSRVHCVKLVWDSRIGLGDAAETAIVSGWLWGIKNTCLGYVFKYMDLATKPIFSVQPDFNKTKFTTELDCIVKIRVGYAIFAAIVLIAKLLRIKGGSKRWQNIPSRG
jgi:hypothetical protein